MEVMSVQEEVRFQKKLKKKSDCLIWTGAKLETGYGVFTVGGKRYTVHRLATRRRLRPHQHVYHTCGNKCCVNPEHLFVGKTPAAAFLEAAKEFARNGRHKKRG